VTLNPRTCWAIFREAEHSPNREGDDAAILKKTAEKIRQRPGFEVVLLEPEDVLAAPPQALPDAVFYMCEKPGILDLLESWGKQGVVLVNSPEGVRNTFRHNTLELLKGFEFFPRSEIRQTGDDGRSRFFPAWVKRLDFHALSSEDVCFAADAEGLQDVFRRFERRGIAEVLVQEHAEGDLIKFYGIGPEWFEYFYHKDQNLSHHPFDPADLRKIARQGAERLNLDIYGGDAIITADGRIFLIDLNAWPSFALYREAASERIAELVAKKTNAVTGPDRPAAGINQATKS